MKNIHLLPTNKPSRLVKIYNDVNRETFTLKLDVEVNDSFKEYVNVYVTSDEEIKYVRPNKGKWHLEKENILNKFPDYLTDLSECKLVIMTTDDDLINDGVQPIPDEFSEWFINNVSCEEVEIYQDKKDYGTFQWYSEYKIIIPKEETKPKTMLESLQEYLKNTSKEKVLEDWNEFKHLDDEGITVKEFLENQKQETLEGVAKRIALETFNKTFSEYPIGGKISNETLIDALVLFFKLGSEWQQEQNKNLYSEEDLWESYKASNTIFEDEIALRQEFEKWFKKYKKK